jgi:molybdopterin-guanine dinucleotide biosynthesis protein
MFIVGFAGPGKVGKSTTVGKIYDILHADYLKYTSIRYAFAQPLYELASNLLNIPVPDLKNEKTKEIPWTSENAPIPSLVEWTPRKFLQIIGTECFRKNISNNFWVEIALSKVKYYDIVLIEDARFSNEYELCDIVIELKRDGVEYAKNHPSAMPPDKKYIWKTIKLHPEIDYNEICKQIVHEYLLREIVRESEEMGLYT